MLLALAWVFAAVALAAAWPSAPLSAQTLSGVSIRSSAGTDSTYEAGDTILVRIDFSGPSPDYVGTYSEVNIYIQIGANERRAFARSSLLSRCGGSGDRFCLFYVVQLSDEDADGISINSNALRHGELANNAGFASTYNVGSLAITNADAHKVDGDLGYPKVSGVTIASTPTLDLDSTYVLGDTLAVEVTFDLSVDVAGTPKLAIEIGTDTVQANYATGTGSSTLVFRHAVATTNSDADGISIAANALTRSSADTIRVTGGTKNAILGLGTNAIADAGAHKVDGDWGPTIAGVSITSSAGTDSTYVRTDSIEVEVAFDTTVAVTGTPQLALTIGTQTRQANYASGTGTNTLVFRYGVVTADLDTDGIEIGASALTLNGGTIKFTGRPPDAILALGTNAVSNAAAHKVRGPPSVTEVVVAQGRSGVFERGDSIQVDVRFDTAVDVTGAPQLALGIASGTRQASYATGSGTTTLTFKYEVVQADVDADGVSIGASALTLNGGTIDVTGGTVDALLSLAGHVVVDETGTQVAGGMFTASSVTDVEITSSPANGSTYELSETITIDVTFNRNVDVTGSPQLALTIGTQTRQAAFDSATARTLVFEYTVVGTDSDPNGVGIGASALSLNGGAIADSRDGTTAAALGLGTHAIANAASQNVDGSQGPPGVADVSIGAPLFGDTFERGDSIYVTVTFNKAVDVTGSPQLALTIGTATKQAVYKSGTGTASLVFGYEVVTADVDNDGLSIGATALALNSGTIQRANGSVNAVLGIGTHAITNSAGHKVAGGTFTAASVSGASITSTPAVATTYARDEQIEVTVTFNRRVAVTTTGGTPQVALTIGTQTRQAAYASGTGTTALVFRYTVVAADADTDGIDIGASALTLNSGTINDARTGGTAASLGLGNNAISAASGHKVDGTLAGASVTGVSVSSAPESGDTYGLGERIVAQVTFDRAVTVTGTPQLELTVGTTARPAIYSGGSGTATLSFAYRVQGAGSGGSGTGGVDADNDGIGVAASALTLNGGTIVNTEEDGARPAVLGLGSHAITAAANDKVDGEVVVAPVVEGMAVISQPDASGLYGLRSIIRVTVTFSRPVEVSGATSHLRLAIEIGAVVRHATYASGSGTTMLVFEYMVQPADRDSDGISISSDALTAPAGVLTIAGGTTDATLDLGSYAVENLEDHQVNGAGGTDPVFGKIEYKFELTEDVPGPVVLGQVSATDPLGSEVVYSLSAGGEGLFEVDAQTGTLTYEGTGEDAEVRSEFVMTVRATSADGEERTGEAAVTVRLLNVNDPPAFTAERYDFGFAENEAGPLSLGAVEAVDLDEGDTLTYRMSTGDADRFELDTVTGEVSYVGAGEDYEGAGPKAWELQVEATDVAGLVATATVTVTLSNVNESPAFADSAHAFELAENAAGPLSLGTVRATDPDRGDWLSYALTDGDAERFKVTTTSGAVQYVGAGEDAETGPDSWALVVTATDRGSLATQTRVVVTLEDRNERPTFAAQNYEWELAEHEPGPVDLGVVEATDVDVGDTLVYRLSGAGAALFEVDGTSGVVQYVGTGEDAETGPESWQFEVVATDRGGLAAVAKATVRLLDVNEAPAFVDSAYAFDFAENVSGPRDLGRVEATDPDRNEALTYSLASGDAARFAVDGATGAVRYVGGGEDYEASPPTFALAVRVTDSGGLTAEAAVEVALLNVNEGPEAVGSLSPPALEASGAPWEVDLGAYFRDPDGDALTYAAESSSPSVASASVTGAGRLSVRPGEIGPATITVTASDVGGLSATQQASVVVDGSRAERARALKLTLAAFGRSLGTETVDAIGGRLGLESSGGSALGRSHVQLGGRSLSCARSDGRCGFDSLLRDASGLLGFQLNHPGNVSGPGGSQAGNSGGALDLAALLFGDRDAGMDGVAAGGFGTGGVYPGHGGADTGRDRRERGGVAFNPITARDIRSQSSFQLSFGGASDEGEAGGSAGKDGVGEDGVGFLQAASLSRWTLWGQSNYGEFEGRPGENFAMDGRTYSIYAGLDYRLDSGFLVGLAGSRSDLAANYESRINGPGTVDAHLNSLYPYASWSSDDGLGVWGVVGAGRGSTALGEQYGGFQADADLNMRMGALGVRQQLRDGLALRADAFAVRMTTAEAPGGAIAPVSATAQRVRLAPQLARQWTVADDMALRTRIELGARYDGGDAETGMGAEAGGEFGLTHQATGLSLAARGRTLLIHQADDFKDWGFAFALRLEPGRSGADGEAGGGLSFSLEPSWGDASGNAQTLWQGSDDVWRNTGVPALGATASSPLGLAIGSTAGEDPGWTPDRMAMEVGYGLLLPNGSQVKPFGRWRREGPTGYRLNVGTQWATLGADAADGNRSGLRMVMDVFGEQVATGLRPQERRVGLLGRITF